MTMPVVALDVDGVLNAPGARSPSVGPGWGLHRVEVPAGDLPYSPFIGGYCEYDLTMTININPSLHGPWITGLRQVADVVWATLWEKAANSHLAPLLGIEPLPVGISTEVQVPNYQDVQRHDIARWKAYALAEAFDGRPLVWVDDMNHGYRDSWYSRRRQATLVLWVDPQHGLQPEHMAEVDDFVARHSGKDH